MSQYVVFTEKGIEVYWTGEIQRYGVPGFSPYLSRARRFANARQAYDAAGEYPRLGKWQVGRRPT